MRRLLREPLLHFLVLGLLLFALSAWRGDGARGGRIVVTAGQLEHLAAGFTRTWQRPPTPEELKGLVDDHVREELAVREAIASGLDRDDTVVRRRLRQKLEFLVEGEAERAPPTEEELQAWLRAHPETWRAERRVALRQLLVSRDGRGAGAVAEAGRLLARLRAGGPGVDVAGLGVPSSLPEELPPGPEREVALTFGEEFARAVAALPVGEWSGPVASGYGLHLVLVRERSAGEEAAREAARPLAERELVAERRRRALEAHYQRLLGATSVTVEAPAPAPGPADPRAGEPRR